MADLKKIIKLVLDKVSFVDNVSKLKKDLRDLTDDFSKRFNSSLKDITSKLGDVYSNIMSGDLKSAGSGIIDIFKQLPKSVGLATGAVGAFTIALGAGFVMAVKRANELKKELRDVKTILGLNTNEAIKFNAKLNVLTANYDVSAKNLIQTSKQVAAAFGVSAEKSIDLIQKGLVSGADANGDFLDNIEEYGVYFKEAGFSAEEFFGIVQAGSEAGIYNDKLPDAIKELNINLKDGARLGRALKGNFSEVFSAKLTNGIKTGAISTKEALNLISEEMKTAGLNAFQMEGLWSNLFAAIGEDVGSAKILMDAVNKGLDTANSGLNSYAQEQMNNLKIQEAYNEELDKAAMFLGGSTSKAMKDLTKESTQLLTNMLGWVNAATQLNIVLDETRIKSHQIRFAAFQESELKRGRNATDLLKAQTEELEVQKRRVEDLRTTAANVPTINFGRDIVMFEGTARESVFTWKTLNREIQTTEEIIKGLEVSIGNLKPEVKFDAKTTTVNNEYQKERANIYRQAAVDRKEFELGQLREIDKIYYEGLDKRFKEEETLTKNKYANQISVAKSDAENIVKTAAGLQYVDKISKELYNTTRARVIAEGDAANATDEQKKKANALRASETAAAKAKLDQTAEIAALEDKMYAEKADRLIKERDITLSIYNIRKDMQNFDMSREMKQTDNLERQLFLIKEQARNEMEKLAIKRKQKAEDIIMARMEGKEKFTAISSGVMTQPELKGKLEFKTPELSKDLGEVEKTFEIEAHKTRISATKDKEDTKDTLKKGFDSVEKAITDSAKTTEAAIAPTSETALTARPKVSRGADEAYFKDANMTLRIALATAKANGESTTKIEKAIVDFEAFLSKEYPKMLAMVKADKAEYRGSSSMSADSVLAMDESWQLKNIRKVEDEKKKSLEKVAEYDLKVKKELEDSKAKIEKEKAEKSLPSEVKLELTFNEEEYSAEIEKIRSNMMDSFREAIASNFAKQASLTQTYINEYAQKLVATGKETFFEPLTRYLKVVEDKVKKDKNFYIEMQKATISDPNMGFWDKAKNLIQNFVYFRSTQFQKERKQLEETRKLLETEKAYKLKFAEESFEEVYARNGEASKSYLDQLRTDQLNEIKLREQFERERKRLTDIGDSAGIASLDAEVAKSAAREAIIKSEVAKVGGTADDLERDIITSTEDRLNNIKALVIVHGGDVVAIEKDLTEQRSELEKEFALSTDETRKSEINKQLFGLRTLSTSEAKIIRDNANEKLAIAKEYEDKLDELTEKRYQTRLRVLENKLGNINKVVESATGVLTQVFAVADMYAQEEVERLSTLMENLDSQIEAINEKITMSEERISQMTNDLADSSGQRREDILAQYDAEKNRLAGLQRQEADLEAQREATEEQSKKRQEEMTKRQEQLNLLNQLSTTISMIAAAAAAIKSSAALVYPGNLIAAGTSIAALVALFATAKSAFKFEKGGLVGEVMKNGGMLQGARHSNGGIPIEAEGGEFIFSREAVNRIGVDKLKALNFNKQITSLQPTPLIGATAALSTPNDSINQLLLSALDSYANRPVQVEVLDIINGVNNVKRVQANSRF